jgi:hypothetical protein
MVQPPCWGRGDGEKDNAAAEKLSRGVVEVFHRRCGKASFGGHLALDPCRLVRQVKEFGG